MARAPFIHTERTYKSIMSDVLIALAPVFVWSIFVFGARAITIAVISVVSCTVFDFFARYLFSKGKFDIAIKQVSDLTPVVTGLLIAFMLPVTVPLYLPVFAGFFASVIARQLFGGNGRNLLNPAVFSIALVKVLLPAFTSMFTQPFKYFNAFTAELDKGLVDSVRIFSPLQMLGRGHVYEEGCADLFYGTSSGNIGEIAVLILILSGLYLSFRKVINLKGSAAFAGTVFLLTFLFPRGDSETIYYALTEMMSGGVILLSIFACNDYGTTPKQNIGKIIFGVGCGAITVGIRYLTGHFDGAYIAVLVMNAATPLIDIVTRVKPYGMLTKSKKTT